MGRKGQIGRAISIATFQNEKSGPPRKVDPLFRNFSVWTEPIRPFSFAPKFPEILVDRALVLVYAFM